MNPLIVYKFRGIVELERDLNTLFNNEIFTSDFSDLNDPFEGLYTESISKFIDILKRNTIKGTSELSSSLKLFLDSCSKVGIYSLSKKYDNELLWSHYADGGKGFCLGYDIDLLMKYNLSTIRKVEVKYSKEPPNLMLNDIVDEKDKSKLNSKLFGNKSNYWSYEDEVRLVYDNFGLKSYPESALKEIYIGCNATIGLEDQLIEFSSNKKINVYKQIRKDKKYSYGYKLVFSGTKQYEFPIEKDSFELMFTNHNSLVECFYIYYSGNKLMKVINVFFKAFKERYSTIDCQIYLFDKKLEKELIMKYPKPPKEYILFSDHCIAMSEFETKEGFIEYPFKDFQYKEYKLNLK